MIPGARITGHVTDSATPANNLANICVNILSPAGVSVATTTTNATGDYSAGSLVAGSYKVQFSPCGGPGGSTLAPEYYDGAGSLDAAQDDHARLR